jgi:hypothetical protein
VKARDRSDESGTYIILLKLKTLLSQRNKKCKNCIKMKNVNVHHKMKNVNVHHYLFLSETYELATSKGQH